MSSERPETRSPAPPSPMFLAAMVSVSGPLGTGIVMQGLGSHVMDWLHPNPDIPQGAFQLLGLFVLACTVLMITRLVPLPAAVAVGAAATTIGLSLMMLNWMVFDGGGQASCMIGPIPPFVLGSFGTALCGFVIKAFVVLIDAIALLWLASIAGQRLFPSQHNPEP